MRYWSSVWLDSRLLRTEHIHVRTGKQVDSEWNLSGASGQFRRGMSQYAFPSE